MDAQIDNSVTPPVNTTTNQSAVIDAPVIEPSDTHHNRLVVIIMIILTIIALGALAIIGGQKTPTKQTANETSNPANETLADKTFSSIITNTAPMTWSSPITGTDTYKSNGVFGVSIQAAFSELVNDPVMTLVSDDNKTLSSLGWQKNPELSKDGNVTYYEAKTDKSTSVLIIRKTTASYTVFIVM